jgi:hypothetical protein
MTFTLCSRLRSTILYQRVKKVSMCILSTTLAAKLVHTRHVLYSSTVTNSRHEPLWVIKLLIPVYLTFSFKWRSSTVIGTSGTSVITFHYLSEGWFFSTCVVCLSLTNVQRTRITIIHYYLPLTTTYPSKFYKIEASEAPSKVKPVLAMLFLLRGHLPSTQQNSFVQPGHPSTQSAWARTAIPQRADVKPQKQDNDSGIGISWGAYWSNLLFVFSEVLGCRPFQM